MPSKVNLEKVRLILKDYGWKDSGRDANHEFFRHPQFVDVVARLHKTSGTLSLRKNGPHAGLSFQGVVAIKSGLRQFHQMELPNETKKEAVADLIMHARLIQRTENAYSFERYGAKEWARCIVMLHRNWNMTEPQIEAVMLSKWTRWAADQYAPTAAGLHSYLKQGVNVARDLSDLVEQTFPKEEPTMEDVNNLSEFKVVSHGNYWAVDAYATRPDDTSRVASVNIANCSSPEMAELVKQSVASFKRVQLALTYLEDGAPNSALRALKGGR